MQEENNEMLKGHTETTENTQHLYIPGCFLVLPMGVLTVLPIAAIGHPDKL